MFGMFFGMLGMFFDMFRKQCGMACGMFRWISVVFRNMVRLIFQIAVTSVIGSLASQSFPAAIVNFPAAFPNRSWDLQAVSRTSAATKRASYAASSGAAARSRSIPIVLAGDRG